MLVLPFPDEVELALQVATRCDAMLGTLAWRHFPDGESLVSVDERVAGVDVVLFASLNQPDEKALALRFAADTARDLGARSVGLVAPYLAYMRQDARFAPGQAIAARAFARFIEQSVDWLVTVDPHLHRIARLSDLYRIPAAAISAAPCIADWIRGEVPSPLLIGPDQESAQWVTEVARLLDAPFLILDKVRRGDRDVVIAPLPDGFVAGRTPVLLDDMASSGHTLAAALAQLQAAAWPPVVCVVTHPLFAGDAWETLQHAGPARVVSTNSVSHSSNGISVCLPVVEAVRSRLATLSQAGNDVAASPDAHAP